EGTYSEGYTGDDHSDMTVASVEMELAVSVNPYTTAVITALYEEDDSNLDIDTAFIHFGNTDKTPFSLTLGQQYLPFGLYESSMINDPLTLEIAETRETAAVLSWAHKGFTANLYAFNGDIDHDSTSNDVIHNFGGRLGYYNDTAGIGIDYINNLADSDAISDLLSDFSGGQILRDNIEAHTLHAYLEMGDTRLVAEMLSSGGFSQNDVTRINTDAGMIAAGSSVQKSPEAWQLELSHRLEAFNREWVGALSAQETDDTLFLGLPRKRHSISFGTEVVENIGLSLEYFRDHDYSVAKGGTGEKANNLLFQLSTEF
ncbi:MAG: LbtU family siderophore porin, partial [Pseudomonadales bacterium]|nr:LbtU family siderophore porin [Pseudomonadales bacterium]